jgi:hypothetical protein
MRKPYLMLFGAVLATGCDIEKVGSDGVLSMHYAHGFLENTTNPIGVGLTADLAIHSYTTDNEANVSAASSSDEEILAIQSIEGHLIELLAVSEGQSTLSVESDAGADSFVLETKEIASVVFDEIVHGLDSNIAAYPVAGAKFALPRRLYDASGDPVTGYGWNDVVISTPELATFIEDGVFEAMWFQTVDKGTLTLEFADSSKSIQILDVAEVTEWIIEMPEVEDGEDLSVGSAVNISIYGETAAAYIGLTHLISEDEAVCSVESFWDIATLYYVLAQSNGLCRILNASTNEVVLEQEVQ